MDTRRGIVVAAFALATACGAPEGWPRTLETVPGAGDAREEPGPPGGGPAYPDGDSPWVDRDGDGARAGEDCDDGDPSVHPGADDPCGDDLDADCDGDDACPDATWSGTMRVSTGAEARLFCEDWDAVDGDLLVDFGATDLSDLECLRAVSGTLRIEGSRIDSTSGLRRLETIGGDLMLLLSQAEQVSGFPVLTRVGGDLRIDTPRADRVDGLQALVRVGGDLVFADTALDEGATLPSLVGVAGIVHFQHQSLGGSRSLPAMPALTQAGGLVLDPQLSLRSLVGLPNLTRLRDEHGEPGDLHVFADGALSTLDGLPQLSELGTLCVQGSLDEITGLPRVSHLTSLQISDAPSLADLSGLAALRRVSGAVVLGPDVRVAGGTVVAGLSALEEVGSLHLEQQSTRILGSQPTLPVLHTVERDLVVHARTRAPFANLPALQRVGGDLDAGTEPRDLHQLTTLQTVGGDLRVEGDPGETGLTALTTVGGHLAASGLAGTAPLAGLARVGGDLELGPVPDLLGLQGLTEVGGDLRIDPTDLVTLDGLDALRTIGGDLRLDNATALVDATALAGLEQVGGDLVFDWNPALTTIDLGSLSSVGGDLIVRRVRGLSGMAGLTSLVEVGGDLEISTLRDLGQVDDLHALQVVGGDVLLLDNTRLSDLSGARSLSSVGGDVVITGNGWLPADEAWALVDGIDHLWGAAVVSDNRP